VLDLIACDLGASMRSGLEERRKHGSFGYQGLDCRSPRNLLPDFDNLRLTRP